MEVVKLELSAQVQASEALAGRTLVEALGVTTRAPVYSAGKHPLQLLLAVVKLPLLGLDRVVLLEACSVVTQRQNLEASLGPLLLSPPAVAVDSSAVPTSQAGSVPKIPPVLDLEIAKAEEGVSSVATINKNRASLLAKTTTPAQASVPQATPWVEPIVMLTLEVDSSGPARQVPPSVVDSSSSRRRISSADLEIINKTRVKTRVILVPASEASATMTSKSRGGCSETTTITTLTLEAASLATLIRITNRAQLAVGSSEMRTTTSLGEARCLALSLLRPEPVSLGIIIPLIRAIQAVGFLAIITTKISKVNPVVYLEMPTASSNRSLEGCLEVALGVVFLVLITITISSKALPRLYSEV